MCLRNNQVQALATLLRFPCYLAYGLPTTQRIEEVATGSGHDRCLDIYRGLSRTSVIMDQR